MIEHDFDHKWHVALNRHFVSGEYKAWMYEAKTMASEVPRMQGLFKMDRLHGLPATHKQCSMSEGSPIDNNRLMCCLGVECRSCPELLALEAVDLTPEQVDEAKSWTCAGHIVSSGGDEAKEGYLLTKGDRMFWDNTYESLAGASNERI